MNNRVLTILKRIIDHYEMDIQWWNNDEEDQAYKDVDEVREYLLLYKNEHLVDPQTVN
jgi:hypothetical protein